MKRTGRNARSFAMPVGGSTSGSTPAGLTVSAHPHTAAQRPHENGTRPSPRGPSGWRIWSLPRAALAYVLAVDLLAVVVTVAALTAWRPEIAQLVPLGLLTACAAAHVEISRRVERERERGTSTPYKDLYTVWSFAAVLLLPVGPALLVVLASYALVWLRVRQFSPHRWIFSVGTQLLSITAAGVAFRLIAGSAEDAAAAGLTGLVAVLVAAGVVLLVNPPLVYGVVLLARRPGEPRPALGTWAEYALEAAALSYGVLLAVALSANRFLIVLAFPTLLILQKAVMLASLQRAARIDGKTGLANATHWQVIARRELSRAERQGTGLGVLLLDLDHFKSVNDHHGHLTGDRVLREVAGVLQSTIREYDVAGRFGGEEFVVLLPAADAAETARVAERIRRRIAQLELNGEGDSGLVRGLTVSSGGAIYPACGLELEDLLLAADTALYRAKTEGRNRVSLAPSR